VPPVEAILRQLLHSVALEELALAALVNAEAQKTQQLAKHLVIPFTPAEAVAHQRAVAQVMRGVVCKERILLEKLRTVLAMIQMHEHREGGQRDRDDD